MKNILITGASGMIGNELLHLCLNSNDVQQVTSFVRKKSNIAHAKPKEIVVPDFAHLDDIAGELKNIDSVFFCLGVYTGAVPSAEFRKTTVDYPVELATQLVKNSRHFTFCLLSGQGADRAEKSRIQFARDKGTAENRLAALGFDHFYTFRPGYIYPVHPRREPNLSYKLFRLLYPLIKLLGKKYSIPSTDLAQAMFKVGMQGADKEILENADILAQLQPGK
jgi:uncharacterized protein YbjT (DUF2867 family)